MNFTEHISEDSSDVEEDDGFLVQSIVFSSLGMALLVLFLFCNKKRVSSCFENYLVVNVAASDEEYAQRVVRQEMQKEMNRMESPEKRTARLRKNFEKNSVIMVRFAGRYISLELSFSCLIHSLSLSDYIRF